MISKKKSIAGLPGVESPCSTCCHFHRGNLKGPCCLPAIATRAADTPDGQTDCKGALLSSGADTRQNVSSMMCVCVSHVLGLFVTKKLGCYNRGVVPLGRTA